MHRTVSRRARGFSLVELLVATSVSGVLASVAYPSFAGSMHKARRTDAVVALMQVQQAQERFRSNGSRYGSLDEIGVASTAAGRHYAVAVDSPAAAGYVVTAVALGAQASDAACRHLQISVDAAGWTLHSGASAAVDNDEAANRRCWNK